MKSKTLLVLICFLCLTISEVRSQVTEKEKKLRTTATDTIEGWKFGGSTTLNLTQTSLTNWAAGGQNSISANGLLSLYANNKKGKGLWENYLDLAYGSIKQEPNDNWWKTDDKIDLTSKYGRKAAKNWYYAVLLNFKTQMAKGYNYPDDSTEISYFLAPGYILGSVGLDFKPNDDFSAFLAPLTSKMTIVNNTKLSDEGAFGVDPGKKLRTELGGYVRLFYRRDLIENVSLQNKIDLFSNYLENPQVIDVSWELLLSMKVNKYISATLFTHLLYDKDVEIGKDKNDNGTIEEDEMEPRVQFKEVLGIGFSYKF